MSALLGERNETWELKMILLCCSWPASRQAPPAVIKINKDWYGDNTRVDLGAWLGKIYLFVSQPWPTLLRNEKMMMMIIINAPKSYPQPCNFSLTNKIHLRFCGDKIFWAKWLDDSHRNEIRVKLKFSTSAPGSNYQRARRHAAQRSHLHVKGMSVRRLSSAATSRTHPPKWAPVNLIILYRESERRSSTLLILSHSARVDVCECLLWWLNFQRAYRLSANRLGAEPETLSRAIIISALIAIN